MADSLLSLGVEKLWNLLVRESDRFQGVETQFNVLKSDLDMLRCFLKDVDAKKHTSAMVRNIVKEIKEIVYDAEDIIETFLLKQELGKTSGIKKRITQLACGIADRRGLAFDMEALSTRIAKVIRDMQSLGVQQVIVNKNDTQSLQERQREMRQTFPSNNEDHLVGLEKNVEQLVGYLVKEGSSQVVSITGMGGIGKTTLARQVFNHEMVKNYFDGVAWVCISQQFTRKIVWQTILQKLSSKQDEQKDSNMSEVELQEKLFRLLETSSSLIVLDDMWKEEDWDIIKPAFPSKKGWKVLLTSRNENVAFRADPKCVTIKPESLNPDESWTLFRRIAFTRENATEFEVDVEIEEIGRQMIKHCGGLPLAVKVLGGLLAVQHTLSEWKRISRNIKSHIVGGTSFNARNISSVYQILYMSFEELPIYLKHCFLYLAHFPEDYSIYVRDLSYYWAAEGIPTPKNYNEATTEEVGNRYVEELVKRNMVISEREVTTNLFETCRLHDMMREVCLHKAEEENFVHVVDTATSQSPCKSRRIAVHMRDDIWNEESEREMMNPKLRFLLFIHSGSYVTSGLWFTRLKLMRFLDLSYAKFKGKKLPSSIGKLIHLRYLSLYMAKVTHLPSSMRNLKQLLYLNIFVYPNSSIYMPNIMKEMRELTYLSLPDNLDDKTKLELGTLVNLEWLENFSTKNSSVKDLHRMTKLRSLLIKIRGEGCTNEALSSSLSELRHLEFLSIYDKRSGYVPKNDKEGIVLDFVHLKRLRLEMYMPRLSKEEHFPSHLTNLSLKSCRLEEDPMPILEKLVQLKELALYYDSFSGRRMFCSSGGFPQLQKLQLYKLEEWEEWIVEEGSMPILHSLDIIDCSKLKKLPACGFPQLQKLQLYKLEEWEEWIVEEDSMPILHSLDICLCSKLKKLPACGFPQLQKLQLSELEWEEWIVEEDSMPLLHSLTIRKCPKLKELPDGLRFISSLKVLRIIGEEEEYWKERLSEGGEDYYKVKHIPSIQFGYSV